MKNKAKLIGYSVAGFILIFAGIFGGFGTTTAAGIGSGAQIVAVALGEAGTVGGDKYRVWYNGSADGEPWCAAFISWCADQCGVVESGVIPKFQSCNWGISWFMESGLFTYTANYGGTDYTPTVGDLIFFTGDYSKSNSTHVGLVQYVDDGHVITIEGNTSNSVLERSYLLTDHYILGYATPLYPLYTGDLTGEENAEIAWNYFISQGCNEYAAAGILGNLEQESPGIVPTMAQLEGGLGRGIAQWEINSSRWNGLLAFAQQQGKDWTSLEVQLQYIWYELNGGDSTTAYILVKRYGGITSFKNAESIQWAVEAFEKSFERAGIPNLSGRIENANYYYNLFSKGGAI